MSNTWFPAEQLLERAAAQEFHLLHMFCARRMPALTLAVRFHMASSGAQISADAVFATLCQNNLAELFMLMHFLDAAKFGSLEEFQTEYEDLGEAKQARRDRGSIQSMPCFS